MSKKLIDFYIHFSDLCINIIAYFYAEIWKPYQIYILQVFTIDLAIPARKRYILSRKIGRDRESRSRQEVILGPRESCCDKRQDAETKKNLKRRILS